MLGNYEKRYFENGEKAWIGRYINLTNLLHWHFECEIIKIVSGHAHIKIGEHSYEAITDDCFLCLEEDLHFISSGPDTIIDIIIFDSNTVSDLTRKYAPINPKISKNIPIDMYFNTIKKQLSEKKILYRKSIESLLRIMIIDIYQNSEVINRNKDTFFLKNLISKINDEYTTITFEEAVDYCGYSSAYFSKIFKKFSGMNFSEYLNVIRVERAIEMIKAEPQTSITAISLKCGFTTIRNFNRVFKEITGYSPSSLPKDFVIDTGMRISGTLNFDPTQKETILI